MNNTGRKGLTRQEFDRALERITSDQKAYYDGWVAEWAAVIAERARAVPRDRRDRSDKEASLARA
jgi:hypothetical protein